MRIVLHALALALPLLRLLPLPSARRFPAVLLAPMPSLGAPVLALLALGWTGRRTRCPSPPLRMATVPGQLHRLLLPYAVRVLMPLPQHQHKRLQRIGWKRIGGPHRRKCPSFYRAVRVRCMGRVVVTLGLLCPIIALPLRKPTLAVVAGHCCCSTLPTAPSRERFSARM